MFKTLRAVDTKTLNHSGRSYIGETLQLEGDLRSSGSVDIAGLINGNVFVSEMTVRETGSIRGSLGHWNNEKTAEKRSAPGICLRSVIIVLLSTSFISCFVYEYYLLITK